MKKILFSPVGSTDPISGQHDGALLHIIRTYKPDAVYLYLSAEISIIEDGDHRYSYCLDKIRELLNIEFEVKWIRKEELCDVHIFDYFLEEFRNILNEIYDGENEIYLNVSSGTPAMKSALQLLSTLYNKPLIPVQVSTPAKAINTREDIKGDYLVELQWECNLDNSENYVNRCSISTVINQSVEIKKNIIRSHVDAFDYVAALRVAGPISEYLDKRAILLLEAAVARLKLDRRSCDRICREIGYDMFPVKESDKIGIFESILLMDIKYRKEEYADFLRNISPIFAALMKRVVSTCPGFNLDEYVLKYNMVNNTYLYKWDCIKTSASQMFINAGLTFDKNSVIQTSDLVALIQVLPVSLKIKNLVEEIRSVEKDIRNAAAHNITYITSEVIKDSTGYEPSAILRMIRNLSGQTGIAFNDENMKTYCRLNDQIKEWLE